MNYKKILVVDDDEDIIKLLYIILTSKGWHVISANTGKEAQQLYEENGNDVKVIILDIQMPEFDGFKFLHWLRNDKNSPTFVLVSTGLGSNDVDYKLKDFKNVDMLQKPFKSDQLLTKLKQWNL